MNNNSKALVTSYQNQLITSYESLEQIAKAMVASGYFKDVQQISQAIVKILAGQEMGFGPFASMKGVHIIQGTPSLSANLLASKVKNDPRYDYRLMSCDDKACHLQWYENGKAVGLSSFTWEDAQAAQLTGKDNWKKYKSDMLFARALTRGVRRFAPGILGGSPAYTPDELGAVVDEEGNVVEDDLHHLEITDNGELIDHGPINHYPGDTIEEQIADYEDTRAETSPDAQKGREESRPTAQSEDDEDHLSLALEAPTLKEFAGHAYHVLDDYDNAFSVVGALVNKYPEAHGLEKFVFGKTKQGEYLQWLSDRKAEEV